MMKVLSGRAWAMFGVAMLVLGLSACAPAAPAAPAATAAPTTAPAKTPQKVRFLLPFQPYIGFYPVHVAQELGYFKEGGLDVAVEGTDGSSFVVQQMAAGGTEFGLASPEAILLGFLRSPNFQTVYELYSRSTFDLYVLDTSPVRQVADFRGKTVATPDLVGGEALALRVLLERAGLKAGQDVQIQPLGHAYATQVEAIRSDTVQALMNAWSTKVSADVAGVRLRCVTCGQQAAPASLALIASNQVLTSNRELAVGVGRALARATLFAETNPDAALAIMKKVSPQEQTDPAYANGMMAETLDATRPRESNRYGLTTLGAWQQKMDGMLLPGAQSGLERPVELPTLVNTSLVDEYNQFDREAVIKQAKDYKP